MLKATLKNLQDKRIDTEDIESKYLISIFDPKNSKANLETLESLGYCRRSYYELQEDGNLLTEIDYACFKGENKKVELIFNYCCKAENVELLIESVMRNIFVLV